MYIFYPALDWARFSIQQWFKARSKELVQSVLFLSNCVTGQAVNLVKSCSDIVLVMGIKFLPSLPMIITGI